VAFNSIDSDRGTRWRSLLVDRFPASTVERLRTLTEEQLHQELGVLAQWEVRDDGLVRVPPTENINRRRGVRERDGQIQIGLTDDEIDSSDNTVTLGAGDILLLLTDGLTEMRNQQGDMFGEQNCIDVVCRHRTESAARIVNQLHQAARSFAKGESQHDDVTVVVVKVL